MTKLLLYITLLLSLTKLVSISIVIPKEIYYSWFFIIDIYIISAQKPKISIAAILFIFIAIISILMNDINPIFNPWYRLISFIIMLIAIGPFNNSKMSIKFKYILFKYILYTIVILSTLSFILYFSKMPFLFHDNNTSLYKGLFNHSMVLGPIAGISTLFCMYNILLNRESNKFIKKQKIYYIFILSFSILCCLLSGSRSALISLIIGSLFMLYYKYRNNIRYFFRLLIYIIIGLAVISPIWIPYTESIKNKMEYTELHEGNVFITRESRWNDRIAEIKQNPIIGSGFAAMDTRIVKVGYSKYDGTIEPGSSWLFILSSTGILGLLAFILIAIIPIYNIYKLKIPFSNINTLISSILVLFFVHMIAEGYILASGSFLFLYLWLCISLIQKESVNYLSNKGL